MGSSPAAYHPRWSSYRDMMPTYNQLAATSLLNQQYNAALGLGTVIDLFGHRCIGVELGFFFFPSTMECQWLFLTCICSWSSPTMFVPAPSVPGLHGIPARRAPMVEQAVQTVPSAGAAQKKGKTTTQPQVRQPVRPTQRSGQVQKENIPTTKQSQWLITYRINHSSVSCIASVINPAQENNLNRSFIYLGRGPSQPSAAKVQGQGTENQKQRQKQGIKIRNAHKLFLTERMEFVLPWQFVSSEEGRSTVGVLS